MSAISTLFLQDNNEKELAGSLISERRLYKSHKMFGEDALLKWYDASYGLLEIAKYDYEFTFEKIFDIADDVSMVLDDPKSTILGIKILQKGYPLMNYDNKEQGLIRYSSLTAKLSQQFYKLTEAEKKFFLTQIEIMYKVTFITKDNITIEDTYSSPFKVIKIKQESWSSKKKQHDSSLVFNKLSSNPKLLSDSRFGIVIHKVLYTYIEVLETKDRNFIQILKDKSIITWQETYPEHAMKRVKLFEDANDSTTFSGQEQVLREYYDDAELLKMLTKNEIKFIINFLYQLIENLTKEEPFALGLAVNLLPEGDRKLNDALAELISKEAEQGNIEFVYMNFMMRGYRYFQGNKDRMTIDNLLNLSFRKMKKALSSKGNEMYIPDFIQVFQEILYRNIIADSISIDSLKSPLRILCEFEHLPNMNSSFPYLFLLYSLICKQEPNLEINFFFKFAYKKLNDLINDLNSKEFEFPKFKKINGHTVKEFISKANESVNLEESKIDRTQENHRQKSKKRNEEAMIKFYQIRNFIEFVMISIEALMPIIFNDIYIDDSNVFVIHKPKYCNNCTAKLPSLKSFDMTSECQNCAFLNANMIFPTFLYHKDRAINNVNCMFESPYDYPTEPYKNITTNDKQEMKKMIMELILSILSRFIDCLQDNDNFEYFYGDKACVDILKSIKSFYLILIAKAANRGLQVLNTLMVYDHNNEYFDYVLEIQKLMYDNQGKTIREAFQFIQFSIDSLCIGIGMTDKLGDIMDVHMEEIS